MEGGEENGGGIGAKPTRSSCRLSLRPRYRSQHPEHQSFTTPGCSIATIPRWDYEQRWPSVAGQSCPALVAVAERSNAIVPFHVVNVSLRRPAAQVTAPKTKIRISLAVSFSISRLKLPKLRGSFHKMATLRILQHQTYLRVCHRTMAYR